MSATVGGLFGFTNDSSSRFFDVIFLLSILSTLLPLCSESGGAISTLGAHHSCPISQRSVHLISNLLFRHHRRLPVVAPVRLLQQPP